MSGERGERWPGERDDLECPECGSRMELRESRFGPFYGCVEYPECEATHGAHPDGSPLGTPADEATKRARILTHKVFDRLWQEADRLDCYDLPPEGTEEGERARKRVLGAARNRAYHWLADRMGMPREECHIGAFDREQCLEARRHVNRLLQRGGGPRAIRRWAKRREG